MPRYNRRTFLKVSGALLGGIATGTQVTAATRTDRFIVETRGNRGLGGLEIVHEMPGVDYMVVRGDEDALERSGGVQDYAPDIELTLNKPDVPEDLAGSRGIFDVPTSLNGEDLYHLEWDKQVQRVS